MLRKAGRWNELQAANGGGDADLAWLARIRKALEARPDGLEKRLLSEEARLLKNLPKTAIPRARGWRAKRGCNADKRCDGTNDKTAPDDGGVYAETLESVLVRFAPCGLPIERVHDREIDAVLGQIRTTRRSTRLTRTRIGPVPDLPPQPERRRKVAVRQGGQRQHGQ